MKRGRGMRERERERERERFRCDYLEWFLTWFFAVIKVG